MFTVQTFKSISRALFTKKSPYYIQFYINGKCNLKCRQCNIVETNSRITEMSLDLIKETAKNIRKIGGGIVLLTGGEPFIRHDLPEIVEAFTRQNLNVRLQTAGTKFATEDKLRACYEAGARDINVSLDSLNHATGDYINSVPGSSINAVETIERITRIFRNDSAILSLGCVLSQFNYQEIPSILQFAKNIGWFVSLVPVHIASAQAPRGFRSYDELFKFRPDQYEFLDKLAEDLIQLKKQGAPLFDADKFLRSSMSFLKGNGPTWRKNSVCDSPNLYFAVRPNGDFSTCCDYTLRAAPRLFDSDFVEQYKSGQIAKRSDVASIVKNCAGCHYGSYPEVTLSVRSFKTFVERSLVTLKSGKNSLKNASVKEDFLANIDTIKKSFDRIYPVEQWIRPELATRISDWQDPKTRGWIVKEDIVLRKNQNRVRGQGEDILITPEH